MNDERIRSLERRARDEDEPRWQLAIELRRRALRGPEDPRAGDVVGSWRGDLEAKRPLRVRWVEAIEVRSYTRRVITRRTPEGRPGLGVAAREESAAHLIVRDYLGEGGWTGPVALLLEDWRRWLRKAHPLRLLQAREI
tara:strand:+ start:313 stop:729 length:417 start_codon:yes stop_codon:yes gene_type:complete